MYLLGTWSDDTSMTLATIDSIISTKTINCNDMASRFLDWFRNSNYTATNKTFDIGRTTLQALAKYELKQVSSITHSHEISILVCYIYVMFALKLLDGKYKREAYKDIQDLDYGCFNSNTIDRYNRILKDDISKVNEDNISTSGYVVSTLEATMWLFLNADDYNATILKAVNLGDDTDTVGACVGGLLGIYYGIDNINTNWKQTLKKYDYIVNLCNEFDKTLNI